MQPLDFPLVEWTLNPEVKAAPLHVQSLILSRCMLLIFTRIGFGAIEPLRSTPKPNRSRSHQAQSFSPILAAGRLPDCAIDWG
ncbi:hypothetical protein ACL6C3_30660 [Capilliphycus salinus ALCB114379]|uniref:hypothetical protein n=1 Tax=Capilliphycus salinus TaxID=2768948 RepID=UPI0039A40682